MPVSQRARACTGQGRGLAAGVDAGTIGAVGVAAVGGSGAGVVGAPVGNGVATRVGAWVAGTVVAGRAVAGGRVAGTGVAAGRAVGGAVAGGGVAGVGVRGGGLGDGSTGSVAAEPLTTSTTSDEIQPVPAGTVTTSQVASALRPLACASSPACSVVSRANPTPGPPRTFAVPGARTVTPLRAGEAEGDALGLPFGLANARGVAVGEADPRGEGEAVRASLVGVAVALDADELLPPGSSANTTSVNTVSRPTNPPSTARILICVGVTFLSSVALH